MTLSRIHFWLAGWKMRLIVALLPVLFSGAAAVAQGFPSYADPNQREALGEEITVPAIRFLTTADFPPFNYRGGDGALTGFNIDLARALCSELKAVCTVQAWPWDQARDALLDNQGDAFIGGLAITPQSAESFDFTTVYMALPARFVAPKSDASAFDPRKPGLKIAVRDGSAQAKLVDRFMQQAENIPFETEIKALEAVKDGQADAYFGDAMRASFWLNAHPDCCAFAGEPYFRPDLFGEGMAIAVPAGHDTMRLALDKGLVRLQRSGKLEELYLRWFPVGFY